eukprot:361198-Chlamydomonas_euryale.AAC.1
MSCTAKAGLFEVYLQARRGPLRGSPYTPTEEEDRHVLSPAVRARWHSSNHALSNSQFTYRVKMTDDVFLRVHTRSKRPFIRLAWG